MRIDNWPMDRVMRLPDWCFGRRWWVGEYMGSGDGLVYYRLGEEELPDKFVVWGIMLSARSPNCLESLRLTIRLGDHVPANVADALTMDRLLKGVSRPTIVYEINPISNGMEWIQCERQIVESQGRRLVMVSNGDQTIAYELTVGVLISSVPKEVEVWQISGLDKNQL